MWLRLLFQIIIYREVDMLVGVVCQRCLSEGVCNGGSAVVVLAGGNGCCVGMRTSGTSVAAVEAVEAVPYFERPLAHLEADCFVVALVVPVMDGGVVGSKSVSRWCGLRGIYKL